MKTNYIKTVLVILLFTFISSCSDEHMCEIENEPAVCRAECGVVTAKKIINPNEDDDIPEAKTDKALYTIKITNECTGNSKKFNISSEVWSTIRVGETLCADNLGIW